LFSLLGLVLTRPDFAPITLELFPKSLILKDFMILSATGKYESSNPGDPYNQEMMWIWNTYHNLKKDHGFKYLYYDPKPLTAKDIRNIYKQVLPK